MGRISLEMLLENGSFPFSDRLLQSLEKQKQELAAVATETGALPPAAAPETQLF